jgi:ATP-binding cassette subfamily F protein uup
LLLVSHDRDFLDNVVTSTLVMEGDGRVGEYVGGYSDWLRQRPQAAATQAMPAKAVASAKPEPAAAQAKRKLGYKEARELEQLPARIAALEQQLAALAAQMNDPAFYQRDATAIAAHGAGLAKVQAELDAAYVRWEQLEADVG